MRQVREYGPSRGPGMLVLETNRVTQRMFRAGDLDAHEEMSADASVVLYINDGRTLTRDGTWREIVVILGHWQLRGYGLWAVEERATRTLIGRIGPRDPQVWPGFELAWMLGRCYRGSGFAEVGAPAALADAFKVLVVPHVISLIRSQNVRSSRVAEKLGERLEGTVEISQVELLVYRIDRSDHVSR